MVLLYAFPLRPVATTIWNTFDLKIRQEGLGLIRQLANHPVIYT